MRVLASLTSMAPTGQKQPMRRRWSTGGKIAALYFSFCLHPSMCDAESSNGVHGRKLTRVLKSIFNRNLLSAERRKIMSIKGVDKLKDSKLYLSMKFLWWYLESSEIFEQQVIYGLKTSIDFQQFASDSRTQYINLPRRWWTKSKKTCWAPHH